MKDFHQFRKDTLSEEIESLSEGPRFRKRTGSKNAWVNWTASSRGPKASLSLSNGASSGLRYGWNSRSGFSASIPGTGLYWRQNKKSGASKERAARKREARADSKETLNRKLDKTESKMISTYMKSIEKEMKNIANEWNSMYYDPFVTQERKSNEIASSLKKSLSNSTLGNIQSSFDKMEDFIRFVETKRNQKVSYTIEGSARLFRKSKTVKSSMHQKSVSMSSLSSDIRSSIMQKFMKMGFGADEIRVTSSGRGSFKVTISGHVPNLIEFNDSIINSTNLLIQLMHIENVNSNLKSIFSKLNNEEISVDDPTLKLLQRYSKGNIKDVRKELQSYAPTLFSTYSKYIMFEFPEELALSCQAIYGSVVKKTGWFKKEIRDPEEINKVLVSTFSKLESMGQKNLADALRKTISFSSNGDELKQSFLDRGDFDEFLSIHQARLEKLQSQLKKTKSAEEANAIHTQMEIIRKAGKDFMQSRNVSMQDVEDSEPSLATKLKRFFRSDVKSLSKYQSKVSTEEETQMSFEEIREKYGR